jgi:cytochrome c oxidase cbb3-type subunit 4
MDHTTLRSILTVVSLLVFVGIVLWALSGRNKERFEQAAQLPFADDDLDTKALKERS